MEKFVIPFFGLKEGKHEFNFSIDRTFFEAFENSLLDDAEIELKLKLEKRSSMLILDFKAKGKTRVPCDRCGDDFNLTINSKERIFVKFGEDTLDQTDDILVVSEGTHEIDISHPVYEMLILGLPNKRLHKNIVDCNQEVIQHLMQFKSAENEIQVEEEESTDPRWDALKKLK